MLGLPHPMCQSSFRLKKLKIPLGELRCDSAETIFHRIQRDNNQKNDATSSGICIAIM
jgi:hypothetical protein